MISVLSVQTRCCLVADRSSTSQPECADATALALEGVRELDEELTVDFLKAVLRG